MTSLSLCDELIVIINPYRRAFSEFVGSRATLEAEGIIPAGTTWPNEFDYVYWQDEQFDYRLCRQRPDGAKGPRRNFANCDHWCVRWELIHAPSQEERNIMLKAQALRDEIYRQSAQGRAEQSKCWSRYFEAAADKQFQAFKALVPGLVRPKRGRRSKRTEQSQGESA